MRIFLIGFMGSGKTYTGRRLAALLALPFMDLDDYVSARAGRSIPEIFEQYGEAYFRSLEGEALVSLTPLPSFVMATGGGTPCHHGQIDLLNKLGTTVFIDPPEAVLLHRLSSQTASRPLLRSATSLAETVRGKLAARRACYEKAHLHIHHDNPEDDVARLVFDRLAYSPHSDR